MAELEAYGFNPNPTPSPTPTPDPSQAVAELEAWIWCLFHSAYLPAAAVGEGGQAGVAIQPGDGRVQAATLSTMVSHQVPCFVIAEATAAKPTPKAALPKRWAKRHLFGARFSLSRSTTTSLA